MKSPRWEYCSLSDSKFTNHQNWLETINILGEGGWELVGLLYSNPGTIAYFKREKE